MNANTTARNIAAQEDAEVFRILVESVFDYAIFMLDPAGHVVSWNIGAERIKGYTAREIIGSHFSRFYPQDAMARGWPQQELEIAARRGRFEDEGWRVRKDGTRFWANVVITTVYNADGTVRGFAKVTRDLTERRAAIALEASQQKVDEFIAMLSHELRNPLGVIQNTATVVQEHGDSRLMRSAADMLNRQVKHLTRLVDDLLDSSRIRSGKIVLHEQQLEFASVVRQAIETALPLIQEHRHRLDVRIPEESMVMSGDSVRLNQMIVNVLNNAAKYTPDGGLIIVTLTREARRAVLSVRDNGLGIATDMLNEIFAPFSQGHRTIDRSDGGLGVGLTLAKRIAEMHGGSIVAKSAGPNMGSEFIMRMPLSTEVDQESTSKVDSQARRGAPKRLRILVVDDNRDSADSLSLLLGLEGYSAHAVYDGDQAVAAFAQHPADAVVLDIGLPGMDGYEVAERLRVMRPDGLTLIALTGYGQARDKERAQGSGFDAHLVKPVDFSELRKLLVGLQQSQPRA
jgi:PAS domain S-box-containing protein